MDENAKLESHERQTLDDGYGAVFHRIYSIELTADESVVHKAMKELQTNLNDFSPQLIARFEKVQGDSVQLHPGDEFLIHITGPWNGPVRVVSVSDVAFRLETLEGHLEAGEIQFEIHPEPDGKMKFVIESLARSHNLMTHLLYDKIPIARFAQTQMWTAVCKAFAERIHALQADGSEFEADKQTVEIVTERRDEDTGKWQTL